MTLRGNLDSSMTDLLQHVLIDLIDDQGNRDVIIDLEHLEGVASSGFNVIVAAQERMDQRGGILRLNYGATPLDALAASA